MIIQGKHPQRTPGWYDQRLSRSVQPWYESPWRLLYFHVLTMLPSHTSAPTILDAGCGTGTFSMLLRDIGYFNVTGADFSQKAIEVAARRCPEFRFACLNLRSPDAKVEFLKHRHIVFLEVMEHVEEDLEIIAAIPSKRSVYLSVPNYPGDSHVRHFQAADDMIARYKPLLNISNYRTIELWENRRWYVLKGVRNEAALEKGAGAEPAL